MIMGGPRDEEDDDDRGAAAVELALTLPLLVLILFAIIEFSFAFNRQQGLHAAAREGARIASLPQVTNTEIVTRVESALGGIRFDQQPTVSISPAATNPCAGRSGQTVTVEVRATTAMNIPFWPGGPIDQRGWGEFRCE